MGRRVPAVVVLSWGSDFVAGLSERHTIRWFVSVSNSLPGFAADFQVGSDALAGATPGVGGTNLSTMGQSLTPREWTTTLGGFSFDVVGDLGLALRSLPRGTQMLLHVGYEGWTRTQFEIVAVGTVVSAAGVSGAMGVDAVRITVQDLPYALRGRQTADVGAHPMFYTTTATTTLTNNEAVGSATYEVGSTANWGIPTGGTYTHGYVLVETALGAAYYRRATIASGTSFSITNAATVGIVGSTDIGASAGDTIREAWGLRGHPLDIVRYLLVSRGDGLGGAYDVYPEGWGFEISSNLVDTDDIEQWRDHPMLVPSSGNYEWEIAGVDQVDDGWSWLSSLLSRCGFFLAMRQGRITCRPAQNPRALHAYSGIHLDDREIARITSYEAYDSRVPEEGYYAVVNTGSSGNFSTASTRMGSLPGTYSVSYDESELVYTNGTAHAAVDLARLSLAVHTIPEVVGLRVAGLRAAVLTLGDLVTFTTALCPSRSMLGMTGRTGLVTGHRVDWLGGYVDVEVVTWPSDEEV